MTTPPTTVREYTVHARSTDVFGRVLCNARDHHFVIDGPVQNNCPGQELTPAEAFLSGVAACGVELIHVIAKEESLPVDRVVLEIRGVVDRANQPHPNRTIFTSVRLDFVLHGASAPDAKALVEGFQRRCPLFGTVATAVKDVVVNHRVAA